ncbi:MAG TPA: V-type ATPase subunit [Clostridia bacterium]|nr:V-type ATPase subunit [Clostridiaceae bacterium]HOF27162.1 V-type ATPase subunit [Clostridia bacterium]HOM34830.1 V-type ATPase subunit [Clostridia bacterium]HOR90007.1 V-type ATPase subunit [Clostridia bacterium]HOT71291.1 V-type ATPase subunit [Clostridia bacterium]
MRNSDKYAHSIGRVRVRENFMMDEQKLARLVDAPDMKEAVRILAECRYVEDEDYMTMLYNEQKSLYAYMREILPDTKIFDAFFLKFDIHNLKVLLKAEFLKKPYDEIALDTGVYKYEELKEWLHNRDFSHLPEDIAQAVQLSMEEFLKTNDPQLIDLIMDKAYYTYFNRIMEKTYDRFLKDFTIIQTDLMNLKAFMRIKKVFRKEQFLNYAIIPGGSVKPEDYMMLFEADEENFRKFLKQTPYASVFEKGDIEKNSDDYIMTFLRKHRYEPLGISPVIGYMLGKETEIKNARITMIGKANRISRERTKERLRMCYV